MTHGARVLLWFLQRKENRNGVSYWGQERIAKELRCHVRTVGRWLAELRRADLVEVKRRGSTSNVYRLRKSSENQLCIVRTDRTKIADPPEPVLLTELEKENTAARSLPRKPVGKAELPEQFTVNECGRRDVNPEWLHVQRVLREALPRIRAARSPDRYASAIIRAERARFEGVA